MSLGPACLQEQVSGQAPKLQRNPVSKKKKNKKEKRKKLQLTSSLTSVHISLLSDTSGESNRSQFGPLHSLAVLSVIPRVVLSYLGLENLHVGPGSPCSALRGQPRTGSSKQVWSTYRDPVLKNTTNTKLFYSHNNTDLNYSIRKTLLVT